MGRLSDELVEQLADAILAEHPDLFTAEDRIPAVNYLRRKADAFAIEKANDTRIEVANRLIRLRDRGVPWTPEQKEQAAFYGVRGPEEDSASPPG